MHVTVIQNARPAEATGIVDVQVMGLNGVVSKTRIAPTARGVTVDELLSRKNGFMIAHRGGSDDWPDMSLLAYNESNTRVGVQLLPDLRRRTRGRAQPKPEGRRPFGPRDSRHPVDLGAGAPVQDRGPAVHPAAGPDSRLWLRPRAVRRPDVQRPASQDLS